jgi:exosortase
MPPTQPPRSFAHLWGFAPLVVLAAGWVYSQVSFWGTTSDAWDHYLVMGAAVWAITLAWPRYLSATSHPRPVAGLLVALPALLILPLSWYFTITDTRGRAYLLWYQWLGVALLATGWFVSLRGFRATVRLLFPLGVLVLSLPVPSSIMIPLQNQLQQITAVSSEWSLKLIGEQVTRRGFILTLPHGELGVAEACSGVKSLFSLAALGAFIAYRRWLSLPKAVLQMLVVLPVVLMVNILRVVLSGLIQEHLDRKYIMGVWHDALSYGLLPIGIVVLWFVSGWLKPKTTPAPEPSPTGPTVRQPLLFAYATVVLLLCVGVAAFGQTQQVAHSTMPKLDGFPKQLPGGWLDCTDIPVAQEMHDQLHDSTSFHRIYTNDIGQRVIVWLIGWDSTSQMLGYHHPDVCLPGAGFTEKRRWMETIRLGNGVEMVLTARQMQTPSGELGVLFWNQEGGRVWSEADETNSSKLIGHGALVQRLKDLLAGKPPMKPERRIMVSMATTNTTKSGFSELTGFAKALAEAVQNHDAELRIVPPSP